MSLGKHALRHNIAEHMMFLSDQRCNQQIDQLDADEGSDRRGAVDPQVAGEQACRVSNAETTPAEPNG